MSNNHDLVEIFIIGSPLLSDASLIALAAHCHKLHKIIFPYMGKCTDNSIAALVSANNQTAFKALFDNCQQLETLVLHCIGKGTVVLMFDNHDVVQISLISCAKLTDASLIAISQYCHKLQKIWFMYMNRFTDEGIGALVSVNHDLEKIGLRNCSSLTDASFMAIADNCPKLKKVDTSVSSGSRLMLV